MTSKSVWHTLYRVRKCHVPALRAFRGQVLDSRSATARNYKCTIIICSTMTAGAASSTCGIARMLGICVAEGAYKSEGKTSRGKFEWQSVYQHCQFVKIHPVNPLQTIFFLRILCVRADMCTPIVTVWIGPGQIAARESCSAKTCVHC